MNTLFPASPNTITLPGAELLFVPALFTPQEADSLLHTLLHNIAWQQEAITLYGKTLPVPRLSAWHGDPGTQYRYSGIALSPLPWTDTLLHIKARVEQHSDGVIFNSVLLNLYRNGNDSVAWHSDDEPELGPAPVIASVSLGEQRVFQLRHRTNKTLRYSLPLPHGSLLLMRGNTQREWMHQIPKSTKPMQTRVNLTFRVLR